MGPTTSRPGPRDRSRPPRTSLAGFVAAVGRFGAVALLGGGLLGAGLLGGGLLGCGGAAPRAPGLAARGWTAGGAQLGEGRLIAVAPLGADVVVASAVADSASELRRVDGTGAVAWTRTLPAAPRALAVGAGSIAVAIEGEASAAALAVAGVAGLPDGLRGQPGAAVVVLDDGGAPRWTIGVGATRWAMVRALAFDGDELLIGGAFAGTLRLGDRVVTAAGNADGFWARVGADGGLRSLARVGGDRFDAVTGVAALTDGRLAIAGTFTGPAELGELTLDSVRADDVAGDGFVAVFDRAGAPAWARTWGGELEDTAAGVVALAGGELMVAGTVTGEIEAAGRRLTTAGTSDGLVLVLAGDGAVRAAALVGGPDVDSVTALAGRPGARQAVIAGRFNGALATRAGSIEAPAADAAFVARIDPADVELVVAAAPLVTAAPTVEVQLAADATTWLVAAQADQPLTLGADALPAGPALFRRPW